MIRKVDQFNERSIKKLKMNDHPFKLEKAMHKTEEKVDKLVSSNNLEPVGIFSLISDAQLLMYMPFNLIFLFLSE